MDDLSGDRLVSALVDTRFGAVEVHEALDSTQTLLASEGGPDGRVVVAGHQTAGRGRAGRSWLSIPGRGLQFSCLLRGLEADRAPLVTLASGVAVARALERCGVEPKLKWPNDVRVDGRKICGMLGELVDDAVVMGIGVNVSYTADELPEEIAATSLLVEGVDVPRRDDLCADILRELDDLALSDFLDEYRERCATIGADVRVQLEKQVFTGLASEVRDDGALVVSDRPVLAGDVIHVRDAVE